MSRTTGATTHAVLAIGRGIGQDDRMPGVVVMVVILVIVIPVATIVTGAIIASGLGWLLKSEIEDEYEGTEYIDLGR